MNITAIRFTAIEGATNSCEGCLLNGVPATQCPSAWTLAKERGLPMCLEKAPSGKQYIYVIDESDPRQMMLPEVIPC